MRGEFELIARYLAPLAEGAPGALGLRDDAALYAPPAGQSLVLTLDTLVEGVHFLPGDPADLVARKLLRVNLSDLAAMGAAPVGYLLSTAWPRELDESWVESFARGLAADQAEFGVTLYGGDTVSTPGPATLSLTAFGTVPEDRALRRDTARAGDALWVSGTIGDGALGLAVLQDRVEDLDPADRAFLAGRYRLPRPRLALGRALLERDLARAALDVSDGLVADLGHIAQTSGLAGLVEAEAVPLSPAAQRAVERDPALLPRLLGGGDDYELLFAADPGAGPALEALAAELDLPLVRIGSLEPGRGVRVLDARGETLPVPEGGWAHF